MSYFRTRRQVLAGTVGAAIGFALGPRSLGAADATQSNHGRPQVKFRPDLLDEKSPKGLEIVQITTDSEVPSSHVYMEAQIFTPDSKRFVLHRSASAHGSDRKDPKHQYQLCDIEDNFALHPLTNEIGATG